MKKKSIIFFAALCVALSACGRQTVLESASPATAAPTAAATAVHTGEPTVAPTAVVVTGEPVSAPTETPVATPASTPATTPRATPAPASAPSVEETVGPSVEPTAPAVVTPAPEVTPPPEEESMSPDPEPTESLCALPLAPTPTPEGTALPETSSSPEPSTEPGQPPELTPIPELPRPTDEEVLSAYRAAREAYTWFDQTTLPLDYSVTHMVGEQPYNPVADERFPTMDALRTYLKSLFSDEVVDRLLPMDGEHYVEIDGVLCGVDVGRGTDENSGGITEMVIWPEEGGVDLCTVHVEVELLWADENYPEGKRAYEFPYQKVGDKWVFTHFESIM